jgi:hypothetical protein
MKRYLIAGMSHIQCLVRAWPGLAARPQDCEIDFVDLTCYMPAEKTRRPRFAGVFDKFGFTRTDLVTRDFARRAGPADATLLGITGNEHNALGMLDLDPVDVVLPMVATQVERNLEHWLGLLRPALDGPVLLLVPPPPIESEAHLRANPGVFRERFEQHAIRAPGERLQLWRQQREIIRDFADRRGFQVVEPPSTVFSAAGFMAGDCWQRDPTHGNEIYGRRLLPVVLAALEAAHTGRDREADAAPAPQRHPYSALPDHAYWKCSVSELPGDRVDPVVAPRFLITDRDQVATAGSCFAQHIAKRLRSAGFRFLVTEAADGEGHSQTAAPVYDFSARYGNVYTSRQLLQLFDRAFGAFEPQDDIWTHPDGGFRDAFRPRIVAGGFASTDALRADRRRHLDAVRRLFLELDVFVFTLGLTECWMSKLDGAVYPLAPGVAGGQYDPRRHVFANLGVAEVQADLESFVERLKDVNPRARMLVTVSPVPLTATREPRHVLVSTVYSKSVLRVAAQAVVDRHPDVEYFPSYEIITGPHAAGDYFAPDRRQVTPAGVDHVMRVFMDRMTPRAAAMPAGPIDLDSDKARAYAAMQQAVDAACDEELYGPRDATPAS